MLYLVRTEDDAVSVKRRITDKQGAPTLYGIDARHGRAIRSEGIVVAIDDENCVGSDHRGHCFCLNVTGADRNEPFPTFSFRGAPRAQMIEISRRKLNKFLLGIEHGVEVAAEDVLKFVSGAVVAGNKATPGVVAGLGVLLGTVAKTLGDISGVVANPLNFSLDAATIQDLKAVWPAIVQFAGSIGIKL